MAGTLVLDTIQDGSGNSTSATNPIRGSAKAWVNWFGGTGAIRSSYNISSVTRTSGGVYGISFLNLFEDANYVTSFSASVDGAVNYWGISESISPTTAYVYVKAYTPSTFYDPTWCNAVFFR